MTFDLSPDTVLWTLVGAAVLGALVTGVWAVWELVRAFRARDTEDWP